MPDPAWQQNGFRKGDETPPQEQFLGQFLDENGSDSETTNQLLHIKQKLLLFLCNDVYTIKGNRYTLGTRYRYFGFLLSTVPLLLITGPDSGPAITRTEIKPHSLTQSQIWQYINTFLWILVNMNINILWILIIPNMRGAFLWKWYILQNIHNILQNVFFSTLFLGIISTLFFRKISKLLNRITSILLKPSNLF